MHLAQKNRDIAIGDITGQDSRRNSLPTPLRWLLLAQLSVHDRSAVPFDNLAILPNDDSLNQALIDKDLAVQITNVIVRPKQRFELSLQRLALFRDRNRHSIGYSRIAGIKTYFIEWQVNALNLHTLPVKGDFVYHQWHG
jgi:hypothetical protein